MGVVGRTDTGMEGTVEINAVNTAEMGTKDMAGMGAVGTAEVAAADTPMHAAIPSYLEGSANKRNGHANKRGRVNLAKKKKKKKKKRREEKKKRIPVNVSGEAPSSSSDSEILLPGRAHHQDPQECS